jgi:hypothetical protein
MSDRHCDPLLPDNAVPFGTRSEAVSLYALGFLQAEGKPDALLRNPMQIGIEV